MTYMSFKYWFIYHFTSGFRDGLQLYNLAKDWFNFNLKQKRKDRYFEKYEVKNTVDEMLYRIIRKKEIEEYTDGNPDLRKCRLKLYANITRTN